MARRLTLGDTTLTLYPRAGAAPAGHDLHADSGERTQGGRTLPPSGGGTGFSFTITPDKPRRFWLGNLRQLRRALSRCP